VGVCDAAPPRGGGGVFFIYVQKKITDKIRLLSFFPIA